MSRILLSISLLMCISLAVAKDLKFNSSVTAYSQDKQQVFVDVSINYKLHENLLYDEHIDELLSKNINSSIRSFCSNISGAEPFLLSETKQQLLASLKTDLKQAFVDGSIIIQTLVINKISLSKFVMQAIEARQQNQKAMAEQMAEMEKLKKQMQQEMQQRRAEQQNN